MRTVELVEKAMAGAGAYLSETGLVGCSCHPEWSEGGHVRYCSAMFLGRPWCRPRPVGMS